MSSKKLSFYNLNGLAEPIRYMLHYSGQEFEDIRYKLKDWPIKSVKDSLPYGQLPLYEENGRALDQSLAIARYVASQSDLLPTDPWEQAVLDAAVLNIYDFFGQVRANQRELDPVKKQNVKKVLIEETVDFFFSRFEKELKANQGFFGGKLTWADFVLIGIVETANLFLNIEIEKKYPTVNALIEKIRILPGVKKYIDTREPYLI